MKTLVFVCGPNGVGKSTTCDLLLRSLSNSARLDSDWCRAINPFSFSPENQVLVEKNTVGVLRNYLQSEAIEYVIFSYGLHGHRSQIFERVMASIADLPFAFRPFILACDQEENIRRMQKDGRSTQRIQRSLEQTRELYQTNALNYPVIDTTELTAKETVSEIIRHLTLSGRQ